MKSQWKGTQPLANTGLMADKKSAKVIRIAVSAEAKRVISQWAESNDMKEIGVASRIYECFGTQPEPLQRAVLGLYGGTTPDVARLILQQMGRPEGVPDLCPTLTDCQYFIG